MSRVPVDEGFSVSWVCKVYNKVYEPDVTEPCWTWDQGPNFRKEGHEDCDYGYEIEIRRDPIVDKLLADGFNHHQIR